ncbi:hypothetical protein SISNIDRAFT_454911 [Sistotremastrum niveocremeum HHB9708]|uniref:Uncharacterized protein n=1 Tax=Sistotremastrum niveocremeum HHB9708 TaxID=1314777 RepID=A0A164U6I4_9AGAM|nr:hypothetical protein SISNIDRAFT_454911 [Sistotremastrum niveocremeum HHB9708]
MDFVNGLDAYSLITTQCGLSFVTSAFVAPAYNFPIFLFGIYAFEREATESLRIFSGLTAFSVILDIVWLSKTEEQNWFIKTLTIIILLLKVPTVLASLNALRQKGDELGNLGIRRGEFGNGTVWSMPGGLSQGHGTYQSFGDEADVEAARPQPPARAAPAAAPPQHDVPPSRP